MEFSLHKDIKKFRLGCLVVSDCFLVMLDIHFMDSGTHLMNLKYD
jgi:hypothetical protein